MDGFGTFVMHYQDASGHVFTSRLISNDPALADNMRDIRLKEIYKAWGYDLLSVASVDELPNEVAEPSDRRAMQGRLRSLTYRAIIIALLALSVADFWLDRREISEMRSKLSAMEALADYLYPDWRTKAAQRQGRDPRNPVAH